MSEKKISKVKLGFTNKVFTDITINYDEFNETSKKFDTKTLSSKEIPLPELMMAMTALNDVAIDFGELPEEWKDKILVRGFTISSSKKEAKKIVISLTRDSEEGVCLNIATPIKALSETVSEEFLKAVANAESAAIDYIEGKRSQADLDFDDESGEVGDLLDENPISVDPTTDPEMTGF